MTAKVILKDFNRFRSLMAEPECKFNWQHIFTLPDYIQVWLDSFYSNGELYQGVVQKGRDFIGAAPLIIQGQSASFIGHSSVCDYLDFSIAPGCEALFYEALIEGLKERGVKSIELRCLRPESSVFSTFKETIQSRGGSFRREPDGISMEMDLPKSWDTYLEQLPSKQRHEIRRKIRRIERFSSLNFRVMEKTVAADYEINHFFKMFRLSRIEKNYFMDTQMESYFRRLIYRLGLAGVLKFYMLEIKGVIIAASLCFDYKDTIFLYNSCYDPTYAQLSPGTVCNVFSIKRSIGEGRKKYDFLKGAETYKRYLGGHGIPLSKAQITI